MYDTALSINAVSEFNGILLDMDGTLVDSNAVVEQIFAEFAHEHDLDLDYVFTHAHGLQTLDQIKFFLPEASTEEHLRIEKEMDLKEIERTEGIIEVPGAISFMTMLIDSGIPMAVVTSASREVAIARMNAAGVPVPERMITADECPNGKPLPDPYLMGAELIGVHISRCVAFEDAEAGLTSALDAGAQTVVVGSHSSPLARSVHRLVDFQDLVLTTTDNGYLFTSA